MIIVLALQLTNQGSEFTGSIDVSRVQEEVPRQGKVFPDTRPEVPRASESMIFVARISFIENLGINHKLIANF